MYESNYTITRQENYKDYERIIFCLKAVGKDSDPLFTHYLHVENARNGSRLIATDGKRLHVSNLSIRIPAGNYQPVVKDYSVTFGKSAPIIFPNWRNVVPGDAVYKGILELGGLGIGSKTERDEKFTDIYSSFLFDTGCNVNVRYIKDLPSASWKIFAKAGRNKLVMLQNTSDEQNQYAVFVPVSA